MVSNHSLWRKPKKFEKATAMQKTNSKYQRKINELKKKIIIQRKTIDSYKQLSYKVDDLVKWLIKENKVTKKEIQRFVTKKNITYVKSIEKFEGKE